MMWIFFLGYPLMDLVGTFNIKVQKKFLNLWYKKMKITLHDISLTKQEGTKGAHEKFLAGKMVELPLKQIKSPSLNEKKGLRSYKHKRNHML